MIASHECAKGTRPWICQFLASNKVYNIFIYWVQDERLHDAVEELRGKFKAVSAAIGLHEAYFHKDVAASATLAFWAWQRSKLLYQTSRDMYIESTQWKIHTCIDVFE